MFMDKMAPGIVRLSVMDNDLDLFEGQYPVPQGVSYNSYLIEDDQLCLLDTVDARKQEEWLAGLDEVLAGRKLDYLVISHMEPDHAGSIAALCARQPQLKLVANARTFAILDQFSGDNPLAQERVTVADGGTLALGSHTLHFVLAPMVHWPEVMAVYEDREKVLFSADGFGNFGSLTDTDAWADEARRYYGNIVGKYGAQVQGLLKKAAALEIRTICPLHGPQLSGEALDRALTLYGLWAAWKPEESGVLVAYAVALVTGAVDYQAIGAAAWFGIPIHKDSMGLFAMDGSETFISAVFTIVPIALATMMEHIGDIAAISATTGKNYIRDPGLNKTLLGDGLATAMAGLLGGPANTTYGENTGVLALTKIYDPLVIRIAAVFAMILSFCPKFEAIINTIPSGIVGGISFVLYGMISAIGVRNVVENRVDFSNSRNLIIAAVILVCALGFNSVGGITFAIAGVSINLSGLAIAAIAGILLNALLPGNDYQFDEGSNEPESASLRV